MFQKHCNNSYHNRSLLIAPVVVLVLFVLIGCGNSKKDLAQFNKKLLEQEESKNIKSYLSQNGVLKARLNAPLMIRYITDSTRVEFPKGLHTEFFLDNTNNPQQVDTAIVESHIYSQFGKYTEFNNKVYLRDSVLCYNAIKKDTLWCDELWWDQNEQRIYTWGKFRFKTNDGQDMRGSGKDAGFNAKQDLSEYTLYKSKGILPAPQGSVPF